MPKLFYWTSSKLNAIFGFKRHNLAFKTPVIVLWNWAQNVKWQKRRSQLDSKEMGSKVVYFWGVMRTAALKSAVSICWRLHFSLVDVLDCIFQPSALTVDVNNELTQYSSIMKIFQRAWYSMVIQPSAFLPPPAEHFHPINFKLR